MSYNSSTFIASYNASTDTAIVLIDTLGNRVAGLNVAAITKVAQEDKEILIVLESGGDLVEFSLDFVSVADAKLGQVALTTAINTLYTNAIKLGLGVSFTPVPLTILSKTLTQYINLANTNALVPLQWYNISDPFDTFGLGVSYNVQALSINDTKPFGLTTGRVSFQIDVLASILLSKTDPEKKLTTINGGVITVTDSLSTHLFAIDSSVITATNSQRVEAFNGSNITVTNCTDILAREGANVTIEGVSKVEFVGITANIGNTLAGLLSNVRIDKHGTFGKWEWPPEDMATKTEYVAYVDPMHYTLQSAMVSNKNLPLSNSFVEANAKFSFEVTPGYIGNYVVTIQNQALSPILSIDKAYEGATIHFRYDKVLTDWVLDRIENMPTKNGILTVVTNGQSSFTLSTKSVEPTKSRLYVNGQLLSYGLSKDYYIVNNILTFNNLDYTLATTDKLEIFYI